MPTDSGPLYLGEQDFRFLLARQGPSLGLWRAAEIAALREQKYEAPVLDLGCGDGLVTSLVLRVVDIGVDPEPRALAQAAGRGIYRRLVPSRLQSACLPAASIGTVVSNSVLEHVSDIDAVLAAVARLLRPGGRLIFTAPTDAFSGGLVLSFEPYTRWRNRCYLHLNLWSLERWGQALARAGLEIEAARPYLRPGLVSAWDALELLQQIRIGDRHLFGVAWRRLPDRLIRRWSRSLARVDLSAPPPGGGRLIVARKR